MSKNKDVEELYAELDKTLREDSEESDTSGASAEEAAEDEGADEGEGSEAEAAAGNDEKPEEKADEKPADDAADESELSEEDIAKLPKRAQDRIRKLAADLKAIGEKETKPDEKKDPEYSSVEDFLANVQDEPSRKLLENFAKVLDKNTASKVQPLIEANAGKVFDEQFKQFEKLPGVSDFRDDLRKTFIRNPSQSLKALVGETIVDIQAGKIKKTVTNPSTPNHNGGGGASTEGMTKEELYAQLETLREQ